MLKCRDIPEQAEGLLDGQLGLRQRLALGCHLLICHHCRRYLRQLRTLLGMLERQRPVPSAATEEQVRSVIEGLPDPMR